MYVTERIGARLYVLDLDVVVKIDDRWAPTIDRRTHRQGLLCLLVEFLHEVDVPEVIYGIFFLKTHDRRILSLHRRFFAYIILGVSEFC